VQFYEQVILVQTVALPEVVFKWLFTGFCAVTAATKLLEEFLPFRAKFKAAKDGTNDGRLRPCFSLI